MTSRHTKQHLFHRAWHMARAFKRAETMDLILVEQEEWWMKVFEDHIAQAAYIALRVRDTTPVWKTQTGWRRHWRYLRHQHLWRSGGVYKPLSYSLRNKGFETASYYFGVVVWLKNRRVSPYEVCLALEEEGPRENLRYTYLEGGRVLVRRTDLTG